ncbi:quinone oxidoreductase [Pseudoalteromonas luteoviolacea]|uniref:Quinone oxidoreductase n=1 Tax=Pseudoalteromonas luteoviolacea TaxID=43657 RepID=A0A1C0TVA1_9GAMM|nr:zinc-dependent alcohol dehydrogenase family protein [Pseudoalteromonas luteoviolacea]OCQ23164.1 quinone oxidoreductase [Pseudoalteromonas luteoviolacea]
MKAMVIKELGSSDVFQLEEREKPRIKSGHLVIEVKATSVNPLDTMLRSTETPWSDNLPEILHGDVAGTVIEVGEDVTNFRIGDAVYGCAGGISGINGALCEYMLVDARLMAHKPTTLSMKEAAALPLVAITAWEALHDKLKIQSGDHILIHGATGGVGHLAIQLAKYFGATVSATVKPRNLSVANTLNADNIINVEEQTVSEYVEKLTGGVGFDAVFDTIAGKNIQHSFEAARINGNVATTLPIDDTLQVALKSLSLHSVLMLIPLINGINRESHGKILAYISTLVDKGVIKPLIDKSDFSIWEVAKAHERYHSGQAVGKIALTMKK